MNDDFTFIKLSCSSIKDPDMIVKYASLGYFQYQYISSLDPNLSGTGVIKNNGMIRGKSILNLYGNCLKITVVDFNLCRKLAFLFRIDKTITDISGISISDLLGLCKYAYPNIEKDIKDIFVKFDFYKIKDD